MKKTFLISLSFTCLLFYTSCSSNTPKSVANKFIEYYKEKNYEGIKSLIEFYSEVDSSLVTTEKIDEFMKGFEERANDSHIRDGNIKSIEIVSENINNTTNSGEIVCKITFENGNTDDDKIPVRMDKNGNWKIGVNIFY